MENPLAKHRISRGLTRAEFGRLLGYEKANPSRFCERLETGEIPADADIVDRIISVTDGCVTTADMHEIRLAWLRANRPERFSVSQIDEAAA